MKIIIYFSIINVSMITQEEIGEARTFLQKAENPLFIYDKDLDGLCAYIILRRYCKMKGEGMASQTSPKLDVSALVKVQEVMPDLIVVLDVAIIDQTFLDQVSVPVLWFDHHPPVERRKVHYYNPRRKDDADNRPTTALAYAVAQESLWMATVGAVSDWHLPDFLPEFKKEYPGYVNREKNPGQVLFKTKLGGLVKVFSFMMKGKTSDVKKAIDATFKVNDPKEITEQSTDAGKLIFSRAEKFMKEYDELLESAKKEASKEELMVFIYSGARNSFTRELSNELIFLYPKKFIIVGREKGDEVKMSMRSAKLNIPKILEKALINVKGYGGGHDHACGGCVAKRDFDLFIDNIRREL